MSNLFAQAQLRGHIFFKKAMKNENFCWVLWKNTHSYNSDDPDFTIDFLEIFVLLVLILLEELKSCLWHLTTWHGKVGGWVGIWSTVGIHGSMPSVLKAFVAHYPLLKSFGPSYLILLGFSVLEFCPQHPQLLEPWEAIHKWESHGKEAKEWLTQLE